MTDTNIEIRYVTGSDKEFWFSLDRHMPASLFGAKVCAKQGYVLFVDGVPAGILRYNFFWDNTPFCNLLYIKDNFRGRRLGGELTERWEAEMRRSGYARVMTSTQCDESAQKFFRARGYRDCGALILPEENAELFLYKDLK